jgi:hypothetical protein
MRSGWVVPGRMRSGWVGGRFGRWITRWLCRNLLPVVVVPLVVPAVPFPVVVVPVAVPVSMPKRSLILATLVVMSTAVVCAITGLIPINADFKKRIKMKQSVRILVVCQQRNIVKQHRNTANQSPRKHLLQPNLPRTRKRVKRQPDG